MLTVFISNLKENTKDVNTLSDVRINLLTYPCEHINIFS